MLEKDIIERQRTTMAHEMRNGTTKERKKERKKRTFRFLMKKTNENASNFLTGRSNRNHRSKIKEIVDKLAIWWLLAIPTRHFLSFKKKCSSFVHFHSPQNNVENVFDHQGYDHQHFPITNKSGQFEKKTKTRQLFTIAMFLSNQKFNRAKKK